MIKHLIKYILLKIKWCGKLKFKWSSKIGYNSTFEGMNQVHPNAQFTGDMGFGSYIGPNSSIQGKIGRFTSIAPFVRCNFGVHPYTYPYVSTAPCFFSLNPEKSQNGSTFTTKQIFDEYASTGADKKYSVEIGNDCWIGEGAFLVGGIIICDGAVVLAHAVVTKDIPPYAIVGGVPAKIIGYRYSNEDIDYLMRIKWWNNSPNWFKQNWKLLTDFSLLRQYYDRKNSN